MATAERLIPLVVQRQKDHWRGEFTAMGSPCEVLSKAGRSIAQMQVGAVAAEAWRIESRFSRYRSDNIVHRINAANGAAIEVDPETANLIDFAAALHRLSDGRFDITSGVLREVWTFDGSDRVPRDDQVSAVLARVGWHKALWKRPTLTLLPGMQIDFGGIGKEYAVDRAAAIAASYSDAPCLINFGGDMAAVGTDPQSTPWRVGIESLSPDAAQPFKRIDLQRGGLATSGDARRFLLKNGTRYSHLLNPLTGWPVVDAPRSVTVAADTCTEAGMLATLAMLMGTDADPFLQQQAIRSWCIPSGRDAGPADTTYSIARTADITLRLDTAQTGLTMIISSGNRVFYGSAVVLLFQLACVEVAGAMPAFARTYGVSCTTCHSAFPRLNSVGEMFADDWNFRLPNWQEKTANLGDDRLRLPAELPLGIRAQAFVQGRDGESIDPVSGDVEADSTTDFQAPYLFKLLASAPLSEQISFYFYAIFAEKGQNGEVIVEDAWFSYDDLFDTGVGMQLGQFQISDVMFPREVRMTFQDFMLYRMAGITYERGVLFGRDVGPLQVDFGIVNGNGIDANANINSPGFRRADRLFDNDTSKTVFARLGTDVQDVSVGLFALSGKQRNATGPAGTLIGERDTDKQIVGVDLAGEFTQGVHWFAQVLWNEWDEFLQANESYRWHGAFAGVDWVRNDRWTHSLLYNFADANDLANTDTVFEGIDISSLTIGSSYYFMRNVKGVVELNVDLLSSDPQTGQYFTGHLSQEHYLLLGFDAAF